MTRLHKLALGGAAAALIMTGAVSKSFAVENGAFQYLAGASIGIPAGAAPPPGLYTGLTTFEGLYGGMTGNQGGTLVLQPNGTAHGVGLGAFGAIVPLVWSTGWQFLGASYSMAVIQPFAFAYAGQLNNFPIPGLVNSTSQGCTGLPIGASFCAWQNMVINTVWQPINLSWNLGNGWFTSLAFSFQGPDGTQTPGSADPDFWTFMPGGAISYLSASWNASLNMAYNIYGRSAGHCCAGFANLPVFGAFANGYTSGNQFVGDWHALYKVGKWEFGPVGSFEWQTTSDKAGFLGCGVLNNPLIDPLFAGSGCANSSSIMLGGLIGYDFGPVDLNVWAIDAVWSQNTAQAGWTIFTRFGFKLWSPEAPKPLVAKN